MEYLNIDEYNRSKQGIKTKRGKKEKKNKPSKKGKLKMYAIIEGDGKNCPKCEEKMQRRKRVKPPVNKTYFFREWDYCPKCSHVQHYEEFKSSQWIEDERQQNFLRDI